jgi:hypothetical protein
LKPELWGSALVREEKHHKEKSVKREEEEEEIMIIIMFLCYVGLLYYRVSVFIFSQSHGSEPNLLFCLTR